MQKTLETTIRFDRLAKGFLAKPTSTNPNREKIELRKSNSREHFKIEDQMRRFWTSRNLLSRFTYQKMCRK